MRWGLGSIAWPTGGMSFWRADKEGRKGEPATTEDRRLRLLELNCPSRCRCRSWPKRFDPDARKFPRVYDPIPLSIGRRKVARAIDRRMVVGMVVLLLTFILPLRVVTLSVT